MKNLINLEGKRVIVRVDFNVPLDENNRVSDDNRIEGALPTIKYLQEKGAKVILLSHLGRPLKNLSASGEADREKYSLKHVVPTLSRLLGQQVHFSEDTIGTAADTRIRELHNGEVIIMENTRFFEGEEKGDKNFAEALAQLGDYYINDAFGTAHRRHASTAVIADYFDQSHKAFGMLMDKELSNAGKVLDNPVKPLTAITGGAKVSDKILLLERLIDIADNIIIGGGMAFTFIKAQGGDIGGSLCEDDKLDMAQTLLQKAKDKGVFIYLPQDSIVANAFNNDAERKIIESNHIPEGWMGLDIGGEAIKSFSNVIRHSKTVIWNGPMGVFELSNFSHGTFSIAKAMAEATSNGTFTMVGGGDSVAAVNQAGLSDKVSFVSTGGGALLEFMEGKSLPGVIAVKGTF